MCGIGGFYNCSGGSTPIKPLLRLWKGLEARGVHAAGFALHSIGSDGPVVVKQAGPAFRLHGRLRHYNGKGDNTQYVLLHTRFTTQGSTSNNANNHPVVSEGMVVTHNGVLYNDSDIIAQLGVTPVGEVDTEAINAGLRHRSPGWVLDEVDGSMSVAWVDSTNAPDKVNLMTNGQNPLVIARTTDLDVVWASTKTILDASGFKVKSYFHAQPFKVYTISPDGAIRSKVVSEQRAFHNEGLIRHRAVAPHSGFRYTGTSKGATRRQNARKGARKGNRTTSIAPMRPAERAVGRTHGYPEDDLLALDLDDFDWDGYFEEEGFVKVWRGNQWVYVPNQEVSL